MDVEIRPLGGDDVDALQRLLELDPGYSERVTGYPPGPSDALSALISRPETVAEDHKHGHGLWLDGALTAFIDTVEGYPDDLTATIGLVMVAPAARREGLGTRLHDAVMGEMHQRGIRTMRMPIVATVATDAEPFARSAGYRPTGEVKEHRYSQLESTVAIWSRSCGAD